MFLEVELWFVQVLTRVASRNVSSGDNALQKCVAFAAGNDGSIPGSGNQTLLLTHLFFLQHNASFRENSSRNWRLSTSLYAAVCPSITQQTEGGICW